MASLSALPGALKLILPSGAGIALAGAIAWGASGGGGGSDSSAQAPSAASTPAVERTPGPPWDPARPDCPQGWRVYNDPDGYFSLCYPPTLKPVTYKPPTPDIGTSLTLAEPASGARPTPLNAFSVIISWGRYSNFRLGDPSPTTCPRYTGAVARATASEFVPASQFASINLGGRSATGCLTKGQAVGQFEVEEMILNIPFAEDGTDRQGYVRISVTYFGPDFSATFARAEQILRTMRMP